MSYKVGDVVRIKTNEEVGEYFCPAMFLPKNRIVTIIEISNDSEGFYYEGHNNKEYFLFFSRIKGYANEYYLQQIKEEMCLTN